MKNRAGWSRSCSLAPAALVAVLAGLLVAIKAEGARLRRFGERQAR